MTLSPVFRSPQAVRLLEERGIWQRMAPALAAQSRAVDTVRHDLAEVIGPEHRLAPSASKDELAFLQEFFFLTLFRALFESLGVAPKRLAYYAELNFCIKGCITAADNLFDDQDKHLLPLPDHGGPRYRAILQLMCFERLQQRVCDRARAAGVLDAQQQARILLGLMDGMAFIGHLEGSEEGGVDEIPAPEAMIEKVHRVRGGALFALAFVAPKVLEADETGERIARAEPAVARLGTAFQIVDDLTDFEFDVGRRTHNLLVSRIFHHGSAQERKQLAALWDNRQPAQAGMVEGLFRDSARTVLEHAYREARESFATLAELGFWFSPDAANEVVHAIVGLDGVARMEALTS